MRCHWKLETRGQRGKTLLSNVFCHVFFGKPQFLKICQPSELPGVRSLHHGGMRQETSVAVLMAQLSGCTLTKWRTLNSTNLKNGQTCRHLVIYDGLGDQNLKPTSSRTSRKIRSRKSEVKLGDAEFQKRWMCRLSRGQDQIDTPQVSPQVAKKPSIKDTIWIKLGDVNHFRNLEISWNLMEVPGLQIFDAFLRGRSWSSTATVEATVGSVHHDGVMAMF